MFQNVTQIRAIRAINLPKILVSPPKFSKLPPFWQITRNSPTIFRFEQREMEPSNFTANCMKIAQLAPQNNESREIRAILVKSY